MGLVKSREGKWKRGSLWDLGEKAMGKTVGLGGRGGEMWSCLEERGV